MTIDELEKEIRGLSYDDSLQLFERLGLGEAAKMLQARIQIHDLNEENEGKPRAVIKYNDGSEESIDIIESVRKNAASIGHPAILLAIHRWEQLVHYHRAFRGKSEYLELFRRNPLKLRPGATLYKIARSHLERVGQALLEGARMRALKAEEVFIMAVGDLGYDTRYYYLRLSAELLATNELKNISDIEEKLEVMRQKLELLGDECLVSDYFCDEGVQVLEEKELKELCDKFLINPIIDFLSSTHGGRKFLSQNISLTSRSQFTKLVRPTASQEFQLPDNDDKWREIVNQFDAWRLDTTIENARAYRSRGVRKAKNQKTNVRFKADDDLMFYPAQCSDSNSDEKSSELRFSDEGYCEETAVYPSYAPKQPFDEILDTSSLIPNDPEYFSFINISGDLAVPYPQSKPPDYLQTIGSWFQAIRTWLVLPTVSSKNK